MRFLNDKKHVSILVGEKGVSFTLSQSKGAPVYPNFRMKGVNQVSKLFPECLNQGSEGLAVAVLQAFLKFCGFDNNELVVDGEYGPKTAEAVKRLQRYLKIEEDGNFGPQTREALYAQKTE